MMKCKNIWLMLIAFALLACNRDDIVAYVDYEPEVAVEGWIESGQTAKVKLSWSAPFNQELDTTLMYYAIRSAKVSVSNGEQEELLTLGLDRGHIPPYVYYGNDIIGEQGKTYKLTIIFRGDTITSETYIPQPLLFHRLWFVRENPQDTLCRLHVSFYNTSTEYYQFATRVKNKENVYTTCLFGNIKSSQLAKDSLVSLQLSKGPIVYPTTSLSTSFVVGDTVDVQFRTLPRHGHDFWLSFQNEIINGQNPIFPANSSLHSNLQGGVGIWCGYGVYTYRIWVMQ